MNIAIRTDGNSQLGMGHVMRCLSLADSIVKLGGQCLFILSDKNCFDLISDRGFRAVVIQSKWNNFDEGIEQVKHIILKMNIEIIVVDSYYAGNTFFEEMQKVSQVAYITENKPSDIITNIDFFINYNIYAPDYRKNNGLKTCYILGPQYAPLRREFNCVKRSKNKSNSILILTGGSDPFNIAVDISKAILECRALVKYQLNIVSGKINPFISELYELQSRYNRVNVIINPNSMSQEMLRNDVAISAAGSTIYELCVCMTPTISYICAENQRLIAEKFSDNNLIPYVGDIRYARQKTINQIVDYLIDYKSDVEKWSIRAQQLNKICDGKGADRIASILCLGISE